MNAAELRIGDLVLLDNLKYRPKETGLIHIVLGISEKNALVSKVQNNEFKDSYGQYYEYLKPIELTEEILLKCGFFYDSDADTFKISNCTMQLDSYGFDGYMVIIFGEDLRLIKNLHQLQNLYFCLTGEELEIKI